MGLILDADCSDCDFRQEGLRLGATHEQIAQHDVCTHELYRADCCRSVQSVLVYMGQQPPEASCQTCEKPLPLAQGTRYRIATLKGEVFSPHRCPACEGETLSFKETGRFH